MFWRKKKSKCDHSWHLVQDDYIFSNNGASIDSEDACYIFCPKCKTEKLVYKEEWQRIERKQEIINELNTKETI